MTELFRTSVKQINMFGPLLRPSIGGCPRSWGMGYLDRLKAPFQPGYLIEGIKHHAVMAELVRADRMPSPGPLQGRDGHIVLTPEDVAPEGHYGRMARASLRYLPALPQGSVWFPETSGFIPWTTRLGVECEIHLKPDVYSSWAFAEWWLIDWKKTSTKGKALKSLAEDVQSNVYAYGLMKQHTCAAIPARWVYVCNKDYAAWPVDQVFKLPETTDWLHENIDATIELMATFKEAGIAALDLPGDLDACGGVGRFCDFKEHCLTSPVGDAPSRLISLSEIVRYKQGKTP